MADGFKSKTVTNGFVTEEKQKKEKEGTYRRMGGKVRIDGIDYQLNGFLNKIKK